MKTILLTEQPNARFVAAHRVRMRDRLLARLCAWQLDRELAQGAAPDSKVALSLHAHRLIGPNVRRALAHELRALPGDTTRPRKLCDPPVFICRQGVLQAMGLLEELADRLEAAEPVEARGVAQVKTLLRNGDSPLFDPCGARDLVPALESTLDALERRVTV